MEMKNSAAAGENIWQVGGCSRSQQRVVVWPSNPTSRHAHPREKWKRRSAHKLMHEHSQQHDSRQPEGRSSTHAPWPLGGEVRSGKSTRWNIIQPGRGRSTTIAQGNLRNTTWSKGGWTKRLHVAGIHLYEISRTGANLQKQQIHGCQELPGEKTGFGKMRAPSVSMGSSLGWWHIPESDVAMVTQPCDYTKKPQ